MKIEVKVLNKEFYKTGNMLLPNPPKTRYNLPNYATQGSAAIDLVCTEDVTIYPGECRMIPTGLAIHIGSGYGCGSPFDVAGLILPRSGLGTKGLILANTIGLIDEDYQGELMVSAWNRNSEYIVMHLRAGDRFAQLVFLPIIKASFDIVEEFSSSTNRGDGSFGSTGV